MANDKDRERNEEINDENENLEVLEQENENYDEYGNLKNTSKKKKSDFIPKIMSLIAAVVLWFYVVGIQSPVVDQVFNDIPVTLSELPEESGLSVISGYDTTVNVSLTGKKSDLMKIKTSDIDAYVDLSGVNHAGEIPLGINVKPITGATVVGVNPSVMYAYIDTTVTKSVPVEVEYTGGTTDINNVIDALTPSQKSITVKGPAETIQKITSAVIYLDIGYIERSFEVREKVTLVDADRKPISNPYITLSESEMKVKVDVNKYKTVPIKLKTSGVVDMSNINFKIDPTNVTIKGPSEAIDKIESVETELVDETKIDGEAAYQLKLSLPANVTAQLDSENVKVNIVLKNNTSKIVALTKENIFAMNENDKYNVVLKTEYLNLNLRGETKELSKYNTAQIYAQYDISTVKDEGTVKIPIRIELSNSQNIYVSGDYYVEVISELKKNK